MINAILWIGGLMAVVSILAGYFHYQSGLATWQTMIFTTLTIAQMGNALATRSTNDNLFKIGLFSNKAMLGSVLLTFLLQIAVVYVPFFQNIFGTVALSVRDLGISFALAAVVFVVIEIVKWIRTRLNKQEIS
jgi:P-type Ca2+ transporter type 2C